MSAEEQGRFLACVAKMQESGYGGPYEKLLRSHGYSNPSEMACQHNMETFVAWHRVGLHEFEILLQDAHEELYGNRMIGLPYWDWTAQIFDTSMSKDIFLPSVKPALDAISSMPTMMNIFGTEPGSKNVAKLYKKGFELPDGATVFKHKSWTDTKRRIEDLAENMMEFRRTGVYPMEHHEVNEDIESLHNAVHVACNKPMSKLDTSPYAIYFWLHHNNIDRLWESYLAEREKTDGTRSAVAAEFQTSNAGLFTAPLTPYMRGDTPWTAAMTFDPSPFNMKYDKLLDPASHTSEKYKARMAALEEQKRTGTVSTLSTDPAKMSMIKFSKMGDPCTLTLYEESFYMHFFVVKKGESFTAPTTAGALDSTKEYVGSATHFGGMEPGEPYHAAELELIFPFEGVVDDYEVKYLFEHDEDEEAEPDSHPLLKTPTFWTSTIGCDAKPPVPDDSWIYFADVPHGTAK
jgi:hypothetical protein